MANSKDGRVSYPNGIGLAIQRGIALIAKHPSVNEILDIHQNADANCVDVKVAVQLGLPNQWMAEGVSPNGVLSVEPVTFSFPKNFPIYAPTVKLRTGFNRALAHVQPGPSDEPVFPCLYDGDINELYHAQGLFAIVDQAIAWLEKAALNELIDPNQGWEPVRRDSIEDFIVADSNYLRGLVSCKKGHVFLPFVYLKIEKSRSLNNSSKRHFIYGQIGASPVKFKDFGELFYERMGTQSSLGRSLALIVTPDKLPSSELHIADCYLPESVTDFASLRERAKEYRCAKSFDVAVSSLEQRIRSMNFRGAKFPIAVVLCVRRPFPLIGESSEIELVPYLFDIGAPELLISGDNTPVFPVGHQHAITPNLLQTFSGEQLAPEERDVVLIGCGSLGSKIAIHMARSGTAPSTVIDKKFLSPHNAARHALLPQAGEMGLTWVGSKAKALELAINGLGQVAKPFDEDVTQVAHDSKLLKKLFPRKTWAIINATASLAVREALGSIEPNKLRPRVIETSLFANGTVGLITVEGPQRNPNSVDLIAEAYEAIRVDPRLRGAMFEGEEPMHRCSIGQGCGSTTMIVSDARISMLAASVAQGIAQMRVEGLPDAGGRILLGALTDDGMGLNWTPISVPPVRVVPIDGNSSWTVRISERAHQKILKDCTDNPLVETGGILVGRISETQQAFIVTDVLPAPQDSQRSKFEFILGTSDATAMLEQYSSSCRYALYCLGTWHSHLSNSSPSERDLQTAMEVANSRTVPLVLLIRTPATYRAIAAINF